VSSLEHVVTAFVSFDTMQIKSSKFKYAICIKLFKYYVQLVKNENKFPLFKFIDSKYLLMYDCRETDRYIYLHVISKIY
jgi:hypothetical protein